MTAYEWLSEESVSSTYTRHQTNSDDSLMAFNIGVEAKSFVVEAAWN